MWKLSPTPEYERRHKRFQKKHQKELLAVLDNLDTYLKALQTGTNPQQIKAGFIHPEPISKFAKHLLRSFVKKMPKKIARKQMERVSSVSDIVHELSEDAAFAEAFENRLHRRQIVKHLFALRSVRRLSQKEIAERMNCSQSRVSKLENGDDAELRLEDLSAYLSAMDLEFKIVITEKHRSVADEIRQYAFAIKQRLEGLAGAKGNDASIAIGALKFCAETAENLGVMLSDAVGKLPLHSSNGNLLIELPLSNGKKRREYVHSHDCT